MTKNKAYFAIILIDLFSVLMKEMTIQIIIMDSWSMHSGMNIINCIAFHVPFFFYVVCTGSLAIYKANKV